MVNLSKYLFTGVASYMGLVGGAGAAQFNADAIVLEDMTATVEITTNNGDVTDVTIAQGSENWRITSSFDEETGTLLLKGEPWQTEHIRDCCDTRINRTFDARKDRTTKNKDRITDDVFSKYPVVTITMPRKADVSFIDARMKITMGDLDGALNLDACYAYGEIGDVDEAVIGVVSGSRLVVGDVAAGLELDISGRANVLVGNASIVDVDIAGPGEATMGAVDGMMDVSIAGSGRVRSTRLEGPLMARIAGSGSVDVVSGRADKLKAMIDGSGRVHFGGTAVTPEVKLYGSSEVHMGALKGRLRHLGGGSVFVNDKLIEKK